MNAALAFLYAILSQVLSFIAIQGSYKIPILKNNQWIPILMGIPVSYLILKSVHYFIEAFDSQWASRLVGQSIGVIVFSIMNWIMFSEKITIKTAVCITLAMTIVVIQVAWKTK